MKILAIDAGNTQSGYAIIEMPEFRVVTFGKIDNYELIEWLKITPYRWAIDEVALEMVACYGMPVGKDVFETCVWIGRFEQLLSGYPIRYVYRKDEKMMLCNSMKAKDSNVRQALINRYAKHDFKSGKGTKKNPDTFYGVAKDVWSAIAVGVTHWELKALEQK